MLTLVMLIFLTTLLPTYYPFNRKHAIFIRVENSVVDPDQVASSEASWFGSTVFFFKKAYIWVQQDKG